MIYEFVNKVAKGAKIQILVGKRIIIWLFYKSKLQCCTKCINFPVWKKYEPSMHMYLFSLSKKWQICQDLLKIRIKSVMKNGIWVAGHKRLKLSSFENKTTFVIASAQIFPTFIFTLKFTLHRWIWTSCIVDIWLWNAKCIYEIL